MTGADERDEQRQAMTVLIAAGGTGGHVFPGLAVADELRRRDPRTRIVFVGTARGIEVRLLAGTPYELRVLPIRPLNRVGLMRLLLGLLLLPWGLLRSAALLLRLRPQAVLGVGGYAGGPVVLIAALLGIRTVLLEPNAEPGFTNRLLRPFVTQAACAYASTCARYGAKASLTGNPIRQGFPEMAAKEHRAPYRVLVFGGSQGSQILNQALVAALPHLPGASEIEIVHQTGATAHAAIQQAYAQQSRTAEVVPFIDNMAERYAAADLIVCRSGATTCAELTAAGKAALLIPFARAAEDHQRINALALQAAGAAEMLEEKDLSGESLARVMRALLGAPERLVAMERAARALARPDAAARVADLILRQEA
ncbi:MAG: undecaprenyldiphospho-muramoylpentapeptide beta-N-acetylglucosaminyltransferase [Vicinamibacteria bacterium]|nr:undecaprenyldiphospho-muramoylpentapeptide beta-N-acetylglucosaminyltransferase [Vicinamibacteria bacterium]